MLLITHYCLHTRRQHCAHELHLLVWAFFKLRSQRLYFSSLRTQANLCAGWSVDIVKYSFTCAIRISLFVVGSSLPSEYLNCFDKSRFICCPQPKCCGKAPAEPNKIRYKDLCYELSCVNDMLFVAIRLNSYTETMVEVDVINLLLFRAYSVAVLHCMGSNLPHLYIFRAVIERLDSSNACWHCQRATWFIVNLEPTFVNTSE